tara:strand:+ start:288 stop:482 length:195 start_codon:yes stop_codon:yes gene_type:complete
MGLFDEEPKEEKTATTKAAKKETPAPAPAPAKVTPASEALDAKWRAYTRQKGLSNSRRPAGWGE